MVKKGFKKQEDHESENEEASHERQGTYKPWPKSKGGKNGREPRFDKSHIKC